MTTLTRCCMCSFVILIYWGSTVFAQLNIPDPNLKQAIREALKLSDQAPITQQGMLRLTTLEARDRQIADLTGLEYAINLTGITLPYNEISDLTPLAELMHLEYLWLWGNPISDLFPLTNLTALKRLDLGGCQVSDITPLVNLTQLTYLTLHYNFRIIDISPLANLTQLTELRLSRNRIVDISSLANLTQLITLQLSHNRIVDVSPLANLTQLTDLTLANNAITDFSLLFGLSLKNIDIDIHKLQELASVDVNIPDPNLEHAIREELGLSADLPFTQLVMNQLTGLDAGNNQIEDLTGLEHATNLKRLNLPLNNISDLNPLSGLTNLENLYLWGNPISDLSPLSNLTNLKHLDLGGCQVSDITPLENLTQLTYLTLHYNWRIVDIAPIANLTQLVELRLSHNRIVDISPLANLSELRVLTIFGNQIADHTPLDGLLLTHLEFDECCEVPSLPVEDRMENRSFPSVFQAWPEKGLRKDLTAFHDLYWHGLPFGLNWLTTSERQMLTGDIEKAKAQRDELLSKNPNMLFLVTIQYRDAIVGSQYPEDFPYWVRDENGNPVKAWYNREDDRGDVKMYLLDFTNPDVQDIIVQRAVAVSKCGLYDGIVFDWWHESIVSLSDWNDWSKQYSTVEAELEARLSMVRRIREIVRDDFLIIGNTNDRKIPVTGPYLNGGFMEVPVNLQGTLETPVNVLQSDYIHERLAEIESSLFWLDQNLRSPRVNCLEGWGIIAEDPYSQNNKRLMRIITTLSLTHSDGYFSYFRGWHLGREYVWYDFWDANLGKPIGQKAQLHQNIEGLFIREFTNGWAVYNRSGVAREVSLTQDATGVASGQTGRKHQLADLDGEIYLRAGTRPAPTDINGDGVVNILDLILVAQNFGTTKSDINGDGTTNILDLILVAQHLGETSTPAAPAALPASLSPETVQEWIDMAHAQNDGSVAFAQA